MAGDQGQSKTSNRGRPKQNSQTPSTKQNANTGPNEDNTNQMLREILATMKEMKKENEKIREEVGGIKQQNEGFREQIKKEMEDLKTELRKRDEKWDGDRESIQHKIENIENATEARLEEVQKRLHLIEEQEERRQRNERRNNIIIKSLELEEKKDKAEEGVLQIFKKLEVDSTPERTRYIGKDWKGRGLILATMKTFEEKMLIMKSKNKLQGEECYIEDDMTKKDREIQGALRRRAKMEREKGNTAKVGFHKIQINGQWEQWSEPKNLQ